MSFNSTAITVSVATFDEECNIKQCVNCSDEFKRYAVQKCKEMKRK